MARPTFHVNPQTIKSLRKACGFTQDYVAIQLHESLGKIAEERTAKSWLSMYQKIESTGRTSKKKAEKLAEVFAVSLETLQGREEIDYVDQLAVRIGERMEKLRKTHDEARLRRIADFMGYEDINAPGMHDSRDIARDVGVAIELVRLSSKRTRLDALADMFDIPREKLLLPVVVSGSWWLTLSDHEGRLVSIFNSPVTMFEAIERSWKEQYMFVKSDIATHLEISRFGLKTRIEASNHYTGKQEFWWCEYAKCEVHEAGVRFLPPQSWDDFFVVGALKKFAYTAANRIEWFGRRIPERPEQLFLRVTADRQDPRIWVRKPAGTRDLSGQQVLLEMPLLSGLHGFAATDSADLLQILNLGWGLKNSLHPFLKTHPEQAWKVELLPGAIQIDLVATNEDRARGAFLCGPAKRFVIQPMWRDDSNDVHTAPCRHCELERLAVDIQQMITTPLPAWLDEENVLPFEPIPDS